MKKILLSIICLTNLAFMQDECSEITNPEECYNMGCEWIVLYEEVDNQLIISEECFNPNDNDGNDEENYCESLSQDECTVYEGCEWLADSDNPNGWGSCVEGEWEDDSECYGLDYEDCEYLDFCEWITDSDNPTSNGFCVDVNNDWEDDDCDPDLACATVITCYEGLLYPTACGPENCDEPTGECDDYMEGCQSDNGQWYDIGQEMFINYCEYYECTENGWSGPFTIDNDNCSDNIECSDLTQDECMLIEECDWSSYITPNGFYEGCIDSEGYGEDDCNSLTQDECEWSNDCEWISDSNNPNSWGSCVEIGNNNDGPPECLMDCEGIEDINTNENPYEACDWIVSSLGFDPGFASCTQDCDDETMIEINEIVEACYECLENANIDCSDVFNDDSNQENCEELNYPDCIDTDGCEWIITNQWGGYSCVESNDEDCNNLAYEDCIENPNCQPNYNAAGQFEGCEDFNNQPNFGSLYGRVEYIYGDVIDFVSYAMLHIESVPSNSNMYYFEVMADGEGYYQIELPVGAYTVTAYANEESLTLDAQIAPNSQVELNFLLGEGYGPWDPYAQLSLGDYHTAIPGGEVVLPLYLSSNQFVGGVQFTIGVNEPGLILVAIESTDPCFLADFNMIDDLQSIGIIFSLEGCSYPPEGMLEIANLVFNVSPYTPIGVELEVFFSNTIVSDSVGNEIPSYGEGAVIMLGAKGDVNADGEFNVLDVVMMVNFVLYIEYPNDLEFWASDMNDDGMINVLDVVQLVNLILD